MIKSSKWENVLEELLPKYFKNYIAVKEYRFHPERRWRFDFAYPDLKLAFEVEGGTWMGGKHVNPKGFAKDCEKYNMACSMGWKVLRLVPDMITDEYLEELLIQF